MTKKPAKVGRPTDYLPEYCEMLIDHMSQGFSYESFAGRIGTSRAVLYDWEKVNPAFLDAKSQGRDKSLFWWEKTGQDGMHDQVIKDGDDLTITKKLSAPLYAFMLKSRHSDLYCDAIKTHITVSGDDKEKAAGEVTGWLKDSVMKLSKEALRKRSKG